MSLSLLLPALALVAALLLTPITSLVARRNGWIDQPGLRKIHREPIPYLGGAAVLGAVLLALLVGPWLPLVSDTEVTLDRRLLAVLLGSLFMFAVGLRDDILRMGALSKLLVQVGAAGLVVLSGVSIDGLWITADLRLDFGVFGVPLTMLWIVGATNAFNIIDGLDSLASGLAIIACGAIAWTASKGGEQGAALLMLTLMGAIAGFLPHNLHPARVFLGDAGSLAIGFLLASAAALVASSATTLSGFSVPMVALGIPILDTSFAMLRRFIEGRSVMSADRSHIHHRLIRIGFGQRKAVATLCGASAAAVGVVALGSVGGVPSLAAFLGALLLLVLVFSASGSIRIKESFDSFRQVASSARSVSDEKHAVDELALAFRETQSLEEWWQVVTKAAGILEFSSLSMEAGRRDGGAFTLEWQRTTHDGAAVDAGPATHVSIPVSDRREGSVLMLEATIPHDSEVGTLGRRLALFHPFLSYNGLERLASAAPAERA